MPGVAVTSDRALVAEAVAAALAESDLVILRIPWGARWSEAAASVRAAMPDVAVMLCDLEPESIGPARRMVRDIPIRWLLLTDAAQGPTWGALLDAGVDGILPGSTTIAELALAIVDLAEGKRCADAVGDRSSLVTAWRAASADAEAARTRLRTLSERELAVLRLLGRGRTVPEVARLHGVAASTVRTQVRSVLRKLGVHSQVEAVAALARVEEEWPLSARYR